MTAGAFYLFRTEKSVDELGPGMLNFIKTCIRERGPQTVSHRDFSTKRTLEQNALKEVWYGEIAAQKGEESTAEARRICKLHFGVPIMRAHSPEFRESWDRLIKNRFSYDEKKEAMTYWPVTSLMHKEWMTEYLNAISAHYAERGVVLTSINDVFKGAK